MAVSRIDLTGPVLAAFTCPVCRMVSFNPDDIANGYCGNCHEVTAALSGLRAALDEAGLVEARLLPPGVPAALLSNALVRAAREVDRLASAVAGLVPDEPDAEAGDAMRWMPGCQEW